MEKNPSRLQENLDALSKEIGNLNDLRDKLAKRGETRMVKWEQDVEARERELGDILRKLDDLNRGFHFNDFKLRVDLNKKVLESLKVVNDLKGKANVNSESIEKVMKGVSSFQSKRFSNRELEEITSKFKTNIGSGRDGNVYKGMMDGVEVAVKVLKDGLIDVVEKQFAAEVITMSKTSHRNLVRLYGFCFDDQMKALVYEYMGNGSLDKALSKNHPRLPWETLYNIAVGTAKGIYYLHEYCNEGIIHRDIKAGNILLDKKYSPRIADFGLAKLYDSDRTEVTLTKGFQGTQGYDAPEVTLGMKKITNKCDVFSFGMTMFEVLDRNSEGLKTFPRHLWEEFEKGQLDILLKDYGIGEDDLESAKTLSVVALWCTQYKAADRPSMKEVIKVLEGEKELESPPKPYLP